MRVRAAANVGLAGWLVLVALVLAAPNARAEPPARLATQVVDRAGVLGDRLGDVQEAVDALAQERNVSLFVVFVRTFGGVPARQWADQTAAASDLGLNDIVLAVAVDDRAYAYSVDNQFPISDDDLAAVATQDIEPRLRDGDWAGAAVGAARAYADVLAAGGGSGDGSGGGTTDGSTGGGTTSTTQRSSAARLVVPALVVGGLVIGGLALVGSRRRRPPGPAAGRGAGADELTALPTEELGRRASTLLIETDDAVKTSEQELQFAFAEFGAAAVAPFQQALDDARAALAASFALRQQLDDAVPEDEPTRRGMLVDIIKRTGEANRRLDEQVDAFDALRDLAVRAPEVVTAVETRQRTAVARVPQAQSALAALTRDHPASAVRSVAGNVDQAVERLAFVDTSLAQARASLAAGKNGEAVVGARAAEQAVAQAEALLDSVGRARTDIDDAQARLPGLLAETDADVAAARAALAQGPRPALEGAVAAASEAAEAVRQDLAAGRVDPVAALRRLTEADAAVDRAMEELREAQEHERKARAALDQTLLGARSRIAAVSDFVTTRRGAVGATARTRLAEAQRHLDQALGLAVTDPVTALTEAQTAAALAEQAEQLAHTDVDRWQSPVPGPGSLPGTVPGGRGNLGGAILGGILLDAILRGGGGRGGGFGGGGWSPGSFGGSGTSGRRGGGGRF